MVHLFASVGITDIVVENNYLKVFTNTKRQNIMKTNTIDPLIVTSKSNAFSESHNVSFTEPFEFERIGIYWLYKTLEDVESALHSKSQYLLDTHEPTFGMVLVMLHRVFELCEGCFITFITGSWASTEITVRSVMEAAVTVMYISSRDREKRLVQYLTHFWNNERALNQKRLTMAAKLDKNLKDAHEWSATSNIETNDFREEFINSILRHEGFTSTVEDGWPASIYNRFVELGLETDYRTIYSFLSSEVHNDANSLVDYMIYTSVPDKIITDFASKEIYLMDRLYLYMGLKYFVDSACKFANAYQFENMNELQKNLDMVNQIIEGISAELVYFRSSAHVRDVPITNQTGRKRHKRK